MPGSDPRLDQGAPVLLGDVLVSLEERERWGQTIFQAENADVVAEVVIMSDISYPEKCLLPAGP